MREKDAKEKYFNARILSRHMILLPSNAHKFLGEKTLPSANLYVKFAVFSQRTKKRAVRDPSPSVSGPAGMNTGYGIHQEHKSSPE